MAVKVYRLATGEDIIGTVLSTVSTSGLLMGVDAPNYTTVVLKSPVVITMKETATGVGLTLSPLTLYITGDLAIPRTSVVFEGFAEKRLMDEYNIRFGSGLVVADASVIANLK